jgi:hypothetical protein
MEGKKMNDTIKSGLLLIFIYIIFPALAAGFVELIF